MSLNLKEQSFSWQIKKLYTFVCLLALWSQIRLLAVPEHYSDLGFDWRPPRPAFPDPHGQPDHEAAVAAAVRQHRRRRDELREQAEPPQPGPEVAF